MKLKTFLTAFLILTVAASTTFAGPAASREDDLMKFWMSFKTAVIKGERVKVVGMTKFPVSMPYGVKSVRTPTAFYKRYEEIFNGEADAAKCFAITEPYKENSKRFSIECGFKNDPEGEAGKPIVYSFIKTKMGWKFNGLDNINE